MLKVHAKNLENVAILYVRGQIVTGETEILRTFVQSLSETNAVILDLARVSKVDAHGLGVLLDLRERTHEKGIRFELMNVSQPINKILEIAHLDSVFQITSRVKFFPSVSREQQAMVAALKSCA